jgi:hypothetical protein
MELFGLLRERLLLPSTSNFAEFVSWAHVENKEFEEAINNAEVDLDFISIRGECIKLLKNADLQLFLGSDQAKIFKKTCTRNVRCCDSKRMYAFAKIGPYFLGEMINGKARKCIEEETEDSEDYDEESEDEESLHERNFSAGHRERINELLKQNSNHVFMPQSDCFDILCSLFHNRILTIFHYGQKTIFTGPIKETVYRLSTSFHIDFSLALKINLSNLFLMPKMTKTNHSKCFPFLLSTIAGNVEFNFSDSIGLDPYRVIIYNSLQHVKKRKAYKLNTNSKAFDLKEMVAKEIRKTIQFVDEEVVKKAVQGVYLR